MDSDVAQVIAAIIDGGGKVNLNDLACVVTVGEVGSTVWPLVNQGFAVLVDTKDALILEATEDWK